MRATVTAGQFRDELEACMDKVCGDHVPLVVTRKNGGDVVVVSREDDEALDETAYLNSAEANARRLQKAVRDVEKDLHTARELVEE